MLLFLISCFSFIFFFKSFSFNPFSQMKSEWRMLLLGPWFWDEILSSFLVSWFNKGRLAVSFFQIPIKMQLKKVNLGSKLQETIEEGEKPCLLDLPDLALECILERLSPAGLCSVAGVCSSLRDRCRSDHLWEKHLKQKWGRVIGDSAYKEWQWHKVSRKRTTLLDHRNQKSSFGSLCSVWPLSWFVKPKCEIGCKPTTSLPADSIMAFYLSLESGKFWFPAQVYNRENGHVGFLLSCYDAQLSYDSKTDTFQARYSPFARRTIEQSIRWDRIRAPPIDNPAHFLHISECLNDLKPGDHIEIQWRRSKEFPYGWWYAVVSHLESCDGNEYRCRCQYNDTVILEFNQYTPGSRWRRTIINRKDHREEGNEADGFYGGIRKLNKEEEIANWKRLWPNQIYD